MKHSYLLAASLSCLALSGCVTFSDLTGGRLAHACGGDSSTHSFNEERTCWLPAVFWRLKSEEPTVKLAAIKELEDVVRMSHQTRMIKNCITGMVPGRLGADAACKKIAVAMEATMRDPDQRVRTAAAKLYLGIPEIYEHEAFAMSIIAEPLHDEDPNIRLSAVEYLAAKWGKLSIPPLLEALNDEDPRVRAAALDGLARKMPSLTYPDAALETDRLKAASSDIAQHIKSMEPSPKREELAKDALIVFQRLKCSAACELLSKEAQAEAK